MQVRNPIASLPSWRVTFYMPDGKIQRVRGSSKGSFIEINPPEGFLVAIYEGMERGQKPHPSTRMLKGDTWKSFKPAELDAILNPPKVEVVVKKAVKDECECDETCDEKDCCKEEAKEVAKEVAKGVDEKVKTDMKTWAELEAEEIKTNMAKARAPKRGK